ncbi:unnamed protein product [Phaeothamnion confervicola]
MRKQREERQSGLAPLPVGGHSGVGTAWWAAEREATLRATVRGREVIGKEAILALQRDDAAKAKADPIVGFVRPPPLPPLGSSRSGGPPSAAVAAAAAAAAAVTKDAVAAALGGPTEELAARATAQNKEEMRRRRLEREHAERGREASIVARHIRSLTPVVSERDMHYHSQYNPERARQNYRRG